MTPWTRRGFLTTFSGAALALPFFPSLALGAAAPKRRFVALTTSNGQRVENFWPTVSDGAWTVSDAARSVKEVRLSSLQGNVSKVFGAEFDPFREKLLLLRGLDVVPRNFGHLPYITLSGYADRKLTIDQILARSSKVYEVEPKARSVHQLITDNNNAPADVSATATSSISATRNPYTLFSQLFSGGVGTDEPPPVDTRTPRRIKVVQQVYSQYVDLKSHRRISALDKARLEEHMAMLRDLERSLEVVPSTPGEGCLSPATQAYESQPSGEAILPELTEAHIDLLAAAIKCDLTRVGVLQLCTPTDTRTFDYLSSPLGDHHGISHSFGASAENSLATANNWYAKQVARLLTHLDTIEDPETGTTYLDNSIVYWGNECATFTGGGGDTHLQWGHPVMLAGSSGGYLSTGRLIDYRTTQGRKYDYDGSEHIQPFGDNAGRPYNELLITLCQAFGLTPAEYEQQGQVGLGDYSDNYQGYDLGDMRSILPFIQS